jgi:hypothetical protein
VERRTEAIVGWRAWRVAATRGGLRLRSAVYDDDWKPGVPVAARCRHDSQAPPALDCSCGIHAARHPRAAARYLVGRDDADVVHRIIGLVRLTGSVVEHEHGWRAARGLPARLWVPAADTNGEPAPAIEVVHGLEPYGVRVELLRAFAPADVAQAVDESLRSRHARVSHVCAFRRYARA